MSRAWPALLAVVGLAPLAGCPRSGEPSEPPGHEPVEDAETGDETSPPAQAGRCGPAGLEFEDLAFVPLDVRMASLRQRGPALEASTKAVAALVGNETIEAFPILVNMEFQGMWLEGIVLDNVLETLHLDPAQLLELHDPKGASVWVVPTQCDLGTLQGYAEAAFELSFRAGPSASIGASPDSEVFPFDVVMFTNRLALAPAGKGGRVVEWFESGGQPGAFGEPETPPGKRLLDVDAAPVRVLVRGQALVAGDEDPSTKPARIVRAGPDFIEVDGTPVE